MRYRVRTPGSVGRSLLVGALAATALIVGGQPTSQAVGPTPIEAAAAPISGPASGDGLSKADRLSHPTGLVSTTTEILQAGVVGVNELNDTFDRTDISVAAIAQIGNTIYVGGKFTHVEIAATGQRISQRFLAAFDRSTGAWIQGFRPTINGNVWDLKATPDGRLIVAGQFTSVNNTPNTTGVAMLNATTGAVDPNWRVTLALTGSTRWPVARTLEIDAGKLYIGGNFTRITGTDGQLRQVVQIARVDLASGNVDISFRPNIDGYVFDIDARAGRVYVVGDFRYVNGTWSIGLGVLHASNGTLVAGLQPWVRTHISNTTSSYQQAVLALGNDVWQAGSEHNRQVYRASDHALIRTWVSDPHGDGQALAASNDVVYAGTHANDGSRLHRDAYRWPGLDGATSSKPVHWMEAFSTHDHEHLNWYPDIGSGGGEGSWELFVDSTGCLWTGGDFDRGSLVGGTRRYVQGFAKFCP